MAETAHILTWLDEIRDALVASSDITAKQVFFMPSDEVPQLGAMPPFYVLVPHSDEEVDETNGSSLITVAYKLWAYDVLPLQFIAFELLPENNVVQMLWSARGVLHRNLLGHDDTWEKHVSLGTDPAEPADLENSGGFLVRKARKFQIVFSHVD